MARRVTTRKILNHSANLHAYLNHKQRYRYVNKNFSDWISIKQKRIIGKRVVDILGTEAYDKMNPLFQKAFGGERVDYEGTINYPQRGKTFVRITLIPDFARKKKVKGIFVTIEDFSKLEKSYQKMSLLDKAKNEFLKIISHELNTPLNGIIGFSGILKENLPDDQYQKLVNYVIDSAERLQKLTANALLITQLTGKTYRLRAQPNDLAALVSNCIANKTSLIDENFQIKNRIPERIDNLCFQPDLIQHIVEHLIDNAKLHAGDKIILDISIEDDTDYVTLVFNDNGNGFSEEYMAYLFDFFASFDSTRVADQRYGLGLASVKLIMDAHDGFIHVSNNTQGGACIRLSFIKDTCPINHD